MEISIRQKILFQFIATLSMGLITNHEPTVVYIVIS